MTDVGAIDFKLAVAAVLDQLIADAIERGSPTDGLYRRLSAEALELSARMYDGNDESFLHMAQRMIALVRTGYIEQ